MKTLRALASGLIAIAATVALTAPAEAASRGKQPSDFSTSKASIGKTTTLAFRDIWCC